MSSSISETGMTTITNVFLQVQSLKLVVPFLYWHTTSKGGQTCPLEWLRIGQGLNKVDFCGNEQEFKFQKL